eukprot:351962-Chlamydomonas_euryale.AAC.2
MHGIASHCMWTAAVPCMQTCMTWGGAELHTVETRENRDWRNWGRPKSGIRYCRKLQDWGRPRPTFFEKCPDWGRLGTDHERLQELNKAPAQAVRTEHIRTNCLGRSFVQLSPLHVSRRPCAYLV